MMWPVTRERSAVGRRSETSSTSASTSSSLSGDKEHVAAIGDQDTNALLPNMAREVRRRRKMKEMHYHLDRASREPNSGDELAGFVRSMLKTATLHEDTILLLQQHLSKAEDELRQQYRVKAQHEDTIMQLQHKLQTQQKGAEEEISKLKVERSQMKQHSKELLKKMAAKALDQEKKLSSAGQETRDWKEKHDRMQALYNELVENAGDLAGENSELLATCLTLEEDKAALETVQVENKILQESLEESTYLVNGMTLKMDKLTQTHEASVRRYEEKLADLIAEKGELHLACEMLQQEKEALEAEKAALIADCSLYKSCEALQQEIKQRHETDSFRCISFDELED